jgi:hypothetical protein
MAEERAELARRREEVAREAKAMARRAAAAEAVLAAARSDLEFNRELNAQGRKQGRGCKTQNASLSSFCFTIVLLHDLRDARRHFCFSRFLMGCSSYPPRASTRSKQFHVITFLCVCTL